MTSIDFFGSEEKPRNAADLNRQISNATLAIRQWTDAADIPNGEDRAMIEAQIDWLEELLKLARVDLRD
jgi:hypothetical protein